MSHRAVRGQLLSLPALTNFSYESITQLQSPTFHCQFPGGGQPWSGAEPTRAHSSALRLQQGLRAQSPLQAECMHNGILRHMEAFHIAVSLNKC